MANSAMHWKTPEKYQQTVRPSSSPAEIQRIQHLYTKKSMTAYHQTPLHVITQNHITPSEQKAVSFSVYMGCVLNVGLDLFLRLSAHKNKHSCVTLKHKPPETSDNTSSTIPFVFYAHRTDWEKEEQSDPNLAHDNRGSVGHFPWNFHRIVKFWKQSNLCTTDSLGYWQHVLAMIRLFDL
jgi:hypothetical protein